MTKAQQTALQKLSEGPSTFAGVIAVGPGARTLGWLAAHGLAEKKGGLWQATEKGKEEAAKLSPIPESSGSVG